MISADLIKKITDQAHKAKKKPESEDHSGAARKAAAKKLMAALKSDNEDDFLSAFKDLRTIEESD